MVSCAENIKEYISSCIDGTVAESIAGLTDIEIDGYNDVGSNGYVFFGEHMIFRVRVAVKYYYYHEDSHEEVALIKSLSHKNILRVWDAHTVKDGWAFFITDEMKHGDLDSIIETGSLDTYQSLDVIRGILSGVGKMHEGPHHLLHRDLKPANILLRAIGEPVIADFGSVKRLLDASGQVTASRHSALYTPPESFEQDKYMITSDIYQLGLVMFQVLGGHLPYEGIRYMTKTEEREYERLEDDFQRSKYVDRIIHDRAKRGRLLDMSSLPFYTHPKLKRIITKASNPEPGNRYRNTADFFLDIHKAGTIPNWRVAGDGTKECDFGSDRYRICNTSKGYMWERSKDGGRWRKLARLGYENSELTLYCKGAQEIGF